LNDEYIQKDCFTHLDWLLKIYIFPYFLKINDLIYVCLEKQIIMTDKNNILYLFDRPSEPIFIGKGDENVSFDVPAEYLVS
jgi:hypothetical protein